MITFKAVVDGDIPANRLCILSLADGDPTRAAITLQTTPPTEAGIPEFNNETAYTDGETVTLEIDARQDLWRVEAATDIKAGELVTTDGNGKVQARNAGQSPPMATVGYTTEQVATGGIASVVPFSKINPAFLLDLAGGGSSYTNEKAMDAVGNAMTGTGATTVTYDDQAGSITVDSTDTDTTLTNAEVQDAAYPVAAADLAFDPATQAELDSVRQGVAHSATATASGDGTKTAFTLGHGMSAAPSAATVQGTSADAAAAFYVSGKTASNVEVTFSSAPPAGTDNLTFDLVLVE